MGKVALRVFHHWWGPNETAPTTLLLSALIVMIHVIALATGWAEAWRDALGLQRCKLHTYLTYALLHDRHFTWHIIENFFLLMFLGPPVEKMLGKKTFGIAAVGLCLIGASAATVIAQEHWTSGGDLVGLSSFTYGLIPAGCYIGATKGIGNLGITKWTPWAGVAASAIACAALIYHLCQGPDGPRQVVHITATLGGTAITATHAFLNNRRHDTSIGVN